ncbi:MAG: helix-turn-helix domain-containing protein [Lachnospiraceae bacterium]|nr:helix-turn-helix domain-containing protein [Lachnospiraceae bacterium]
MKRTEISKIEFKNRIREFRLEKRLSQTALAKLSFTTQNTISSIETGQYSPSAYLSGLICKALNCKWEDCFYYEKDKNQSL